MAARLAHPLRTLSLWRSSPGLCQRSQPVPASRPHSTQITFGCCPHRRMNPVRGAPCTPPIDQGHAWRHVWSATLADIFSQHSVFYIASNANVLKSLAYLTHTSIHARDHTPTFSADKSHRHVLSTTLKSNFSPGRGTIEHSHRSVATSIRAEARTAVK
jgi:hypothetical protein